MTNLSPHFSLYELTRTDTGLRNLPDTEDKMDALRRTAHHMEAVRDILGKPIVIKSGYRSPEVNKAVGGAHDSQHMQGEACDFVCPEFGTPQEVAHKLIAAGLKVDQIIAEKSWIHISWGPRMRGEILTAHFSPGYATTYTEGIA